MSDARADAAAWLRKAQQDLEAAEVLGRAPDPLWDIVVFHAQQAAEKFLKGAIVFVGHQPPKSHDLVRLLSLSLARFPELQRFTDDCAFLSPLAVLSRYPGDNPESAEEDAKRGLAIAVRVRDAVLDVLQRDDASSS